MNPQVNDKTFHSEPIDRFVNQIVRIYFTRIFYVMQMFTITCKHGIQPGKGGQLLIWYSENVGTIADYAKILTHHDPIYIEIVYKTKPKLATPKWKCSYFDEIFIIGYIQSSPNDNFWRNQ